VLRVNYVFVLRFCHSLVQEPIGQYKAGDGPVGTHVQHNCLTNGETFYLPGLNVDAEHVLQRLHHNLILHRFEITPTYIIWLA